MAVRDLAADIRVRESIKRGSHTTSQTGAEVDLQGFNGAALALVVTTLTNGTHTPKLQHSNTSGSNFANVNTTTDQAGSLAVLAASTNQKVSYMGPKRYVRAKCVLTGSTGGATYQALFVAGAASQSPAAV